jgi:tetratricopeptide (TPR) repeat protein
MAPRPAARVLLALALLAPLSAARGGFVHRSTDPRDEDRRAEPEPAKPYRPSFSEFEFYIDEPPGAPVIPAPSFIQAPEYSFPGPEKHPPVLALPGQMIYDLDRPPKTRHLWKYPAYVVFGAPRDLVDALFGAVSYVPVLNLALTGAYEYSGAQYLMRHPRDFHAYGGGPNDRGHAWISGTSWGWFSNAKRTRFVETDQARLSAYKAHNDQVLSRLAVMNESAQSGNEEIDRQARAYFEQARRDWQAGRYAEALARLWSYCLRRPTDYEARAYLAACCMQQAGVGVKHARWCDQQVRRSLAEWPPGSLPVLIQTLRRHIQGQPDDLNARHWQIWIYTRLGSYAEALAEGRRLAADPGAGMRENSLYYEVCMRRLQELSPEEDFEAIVDLLRRLENAVERMRRLAPRSPETLLAAARLHVMAGNYDTGLEALRRLAEEFPDQARFGYYFGAGLMLEGLFGRQYDRAAAVAVLERAKVRAETARRESVIAEALSHARSIQAQPRPRAPAVAE